MFFEFKQRISRTESQNAQWHLQPKHSIATLGAWQGKTLDHNPREASISVLLNRKAGGITHRIPLDHHSTTRKPIYSSYIQPDKIIRNRREVEQITWSPPHDIHSIAPLDRRVAGPFHLVFTWDHSIARLSPRSLVWSMTYSTKGGPFQPIRCSIAGSRHEDYYLFSLLICFIFAYINNL